MLRNKNILLSRWAALIFSSLLLMSLMISSCSKDFTSAKSALQGAPTGTDFWANADAATAARAVNAIYANLRTWNNVAFAAICVENMGSDDAIKGSVATDATYINEYDNFTVDASEGQLDGFWTAQYQNINLCNQVLANVPAISMDASLKSRYEGEAKFIRAWSYFRLVRAFGNIPLIMKLPQTAEELNPKQSTAAEVYAAIDQDLTEAAGLLPATYGAADVGRATKGAALSLHAKVDMYEAGKDASKWQNVLDYTNSVIQSGVYSLYPDYYAMFRIRGENCSESIFEVQCNYVAGNSDISNSQYAQVQGNRETNAGWGFNVPTTDLLNAFEPGDPRLAATIMRAGVTTPDGDVVPPPSAGAPTMYNMKAYVPFTLAVATNQGADQNVRVLRYADVLLMNAEANNELGHAADALTSLEKVRARARAKSANPTVDLPKITTTDKDQLRKAIYHERRVELAMENDRYFDVIRQGRAATIFGPLGWVAKDSIWPIPQAEIDNSGGILVQNAGW